MKKDNYEEQLLHYTHRAGDFQKVKEAVEAGANVNVRDSSGFTPLMNASMFNYVDIVTYLLDNGADPNLKSRESDHFPDGRVALDMAAQYNCIETMALLLKYHAEIEPNDTLCSPLNRAAREGHLEAVKLLIRNGANVNNRDYFDHHTPLMCAVEAGHANVVAYLLNKDNIESIDKRGRTPLLIAAKENHTAVVSLLVARGANVKHIDFNGSNVFDLAISHEVRDIIFSLEEQRKLDKMVQQQQADIQII